LDPVENISLLAPLFDMPLPEDRTPTSTPEELRRRQLAALTAWVLAGARAQPVVLALEDMHWADPTTLDLLRGIAERGALAPLFVLSTARPEFRQPWGARSHHGTISLVPLDRQQVRDMVGELAARHALSKEAIEGVTERTGGVPLFVEEVTRLLLERGEQGGIQAIPPTLQQSLAARLDRLGAAREVAQIGAVAGRDFSYALLRAVAGIEDTPLQTELERLAEADVLLVQGLPPNSDYRFKHALIQDAAYDNLLKSRRQLLHRRVGEVLRDEFAAVASTEPELLAHHFTQAGMIETAIEWWGKAGQRSLERSALAEAIEHFTRALAQIATLSSTPDLRRQEIRFQVALITPLHNVIGFAAAETKEAIERARLLIEQAEERGETLDDPLLLLSVLFGVAVTNFVTFNGEVMRESAAQFLAIAMRQGLSGPRMLGHSLMGNYFAATGDFAQARAHYDEGIALYDPAAYRPLVTHFAAQDERVALLSFRSLTLWMLGYPEAALEDAKHALEDARQIGQAATLLLALNWTSLTQTSCRNYGAANAPLSDQLIAMADQTGSFAWKTRGILNQGNVSALTGNAAEAVQNDHLLLNGKSVYGSDPGSTIELVLLGPRLC
jgi:tetratricopeptide (TPR) repeat protein